MKTLKGNGFIIHPSGDEFAVQYDLLEYKSGTLTETMGRVTPVPKDWVCVMNGLVLKIEDGRKLPFFFLDSNGSKGSVRINEPL
jgi:hypothetical protein